MEEKKPSLNYNFICFNWTQFLGALNDNLYKFVVVYFLVGISGENSTTVTAYVGLIFVLPFLVFSEAAGILADRISKSKIAVFTQILEIIIMSCGLIVFMLNSVWGAYCVLFFMSVQSTLFGPVKYGIVPEIVSKSQISRSNGIMAFFTFLAIIIGTFLASYVVQVSSRDFVLAGVVCVVVSSLGFLFSLFIKKTPSAGSTKMPNPWFVTEMFRNIRFSLNYEHLTLCIFTSAAFIFVASYVQLNIVPYTIEMLHLSDIHAGYLFLLSGVGIGAGSIISGYIAKNRIELSLIFVGVIGIIISLIMLGLGYHSLQFIIFSLLFLGLCAGILIIPSDSYIQIKSPNAYRGQMFATMNFLSFSGALISAILMYLFGNFLHINPAEGFLCFAGITLFLLLVGYWDIRPELWTSVIRIYNHFKRNKVRIDLSSNLSFSPSLCVVYDEALPHLASIIGSQKGNFRLMYCYGKKIPWFIKKASFNFLNFSSSKKLEEKISYNIKNGFHLFFLLSDLEQLKLKNIAIYQWWTSLVESSFYPTFLVKTSSHNPEFVDFQKVNSQKMVVEIFGNELDGNENRAI